MSTRKFVVNLVLYQIAWLSCILGGGNGMPWFGVLVVLAVVAYHLMSAARPELELRLIAAAALIGAVWDSLLVAAGWLAYPSGTLVSNTAPYWIVALWIVFATTFNVSMAWFKSRLLAASVFGAVGGPLAYLAGERLGGVVMAEPVASMVALALGWALWMPLMMLLARRWNGFDVNQPRVAASMG